MLPQKCFKLEECSFFWKIKIDMPNKSIYKSEGCNLTSKVSGKDSVGRAGRSLNFTLINYPRKQKSFRD